MALKLSVPLIGEDNGIFLQSWFFSLMKFINYNISLEISKPTLHGASFVPKYKRRNQIWKVSQYRAFSGPYFPVLGLDAERYSVSLHIQSEYRKIRTRKNFVFGHFSHSHIVVKKSICSKKKDTHAILIEMILISIIIIIVILLCRFIAFARQCLMPTYSSWASYT